MDAFAKRLNSLQKEIVLVAGLESTAPLMVIKGKQSHPTVTGLGRNKSRNEKNQPHSSTMPTLLVEGVVSSRAEDSWGVSSMSSLRD